MQYFDCDLAARTILSMSCLRASYNLLVERGSGRPRGFATVTMAIPQGANAAVLGLHGEEVEARVLTAAEHVPALRGVACYRAERNSLGAGGEAECVRYCAK
jgi:hypothetical protein